MTVAALILLFLFLDLFLDVGRLAVHFYLLCRIDKLHDNGLYNPPVREGADKEVCSGGRRHVPGGRTHEQVILEVGVNPLRPGVDEGEGDESVKNVRNEYILNRCLLYISDCEKV